MQSLKMITAIKFSIQNSQSAFSIPNFAIGNMGSPINGLLPKQFLLTPSQKGRKNFAAPASRNTLRERDIEYGLGTHFDSSESSPALVGGQSTLSESR
jgi:hypothetical protein